MENKLTSYLLYLSYHARVVLHALRYKNDPKLLHELRVTLRKIYSLITLFADRSAPLSKFLKNTMESTNHIRELDVLLESLSHSRYPTIVKNLAKERKNCFYSLFTPLYIDQTCVSLNQYSKTLVVDDTIFLSDILIQKVLTHYHYCLDSFQLLENTADSKTLHKLRIKFKDARYGFEFLDISGIHQCQEVIEHCKEFQTLLGSIQDKVNQITLLKAHYKHSPSLELKTLIQKEKKKLKMIKETTRSELSSSI